MLSKVWAVTGRRVDWKKRTGAGAEAGEGEREESSSSTPRLLHVGQFGFDADSDANVGVGLTDRRRSSSAVTVVLRRAGGSGAVAGAGAGQIRIRKWSNTSPGMASRKNIDSNTAMENESPRGGANSNLNLNSKLLTVDKKIRGRSMSARKANETRPHSDSTNLKLPSGGSVRVRRSSDLINEMGYLKLTPVQMTLIRKLWQNVRAQGKNGAGLQILRDHLFFRYPDIRDLFAIGGSSPSETNYHKRLMAHAEALGGLLDEVINNLEEADCIRNKIRELGKLHIRIRENGFKAGHWDNLAEALNECTLAWCQKAQRRFETQVAMTTMVMFIVDNLKDGYQEECRRLRRAGYEGGGSRDRTPTMERDMDLTRAHKRV